MKIFSLPFKVAKEVVKRNTKDNRRLTSHRADGGNNYELVMQIMGALSGAGFPNISLVTDTK